MVCLKLPSVDYKVTNDKSFIRMAQPLQENDVVELIQFADDGVPTVAKFGYRQFKDMMNRTVSQTFRRQSKIQIN